MIPRLLEDCRLFLDMEMLYLCHHRLHKLRILMMQIQRKSLPHVLFFFYPFFLSSFSVTLKSYKHDETLLALFFFHT